MNDWSDVVGAAKGALATAAIVGVTAATNADALVHAATPDIAETQPATMFVEAMEDVPGALKDTLDQEAAAEDAMQNAVSEPESAERAPADEAVAAAIADAQAQDASVAAEAAEAEAADAEAADAEAAETADGSDFGDSDFGGSDAGPDGGGAA